MPPREISAVPSYSRDAVFTRPQDLPEDWYQLWEGLVTDMRRESQSLPMNTMMALLVERIATMYVQVRMQEGTPAGAEYLQDLQALWLKMVKEFAVQLHRNSQTPEQRFVAGFKAAVSTAARKAGQNCTVRDFLPILAQELEAYGV